MLIVVAGPSGVGKSRLLDLATRSLEFRTATPVTSRRPRDGEIDGQDYYFCDRNAFRTRIEEGQLFEWDFVLRNYYGYGHELRALAEGAEPAIVQILARMGLRVAARLPDVFSLYLRARDQQLLSERLEARAYDERELLLREEHWAEEEAHSHLFDLVVNEAELVNDDAVLEVLQEASIGMR